MRAYLSVRVILNVLILRPIIRMILGLAVEGKEHFRGLNQYILAANHNSHLDALLLFSAIPIGHIHKTRVVAAEDYFREHNVLFSLISCLFRPVWISRKKETRTQDPFETMTDAMEQGDNLIIFPEGTRGEPGRLQDFKLGVGRLAEKFREVPIVPVFLLGPERALPRQASFLVPVWQHVIVGPPQQVVGSPVDTTQTLQNCIIDLGRSRAAERRIRQDVQPKRNVIVAVVGIDGSGKSTLSEALARLLSSDHLVCRVSDQLQFYNRQQAKTIQPFLKEYIRQGLSKFTKKVKSLKAYKVPKLAELLLREALLSEIHRWYKPDFVVMDGAPLMNITAWSTIYRRERVDEEMCAKAMTVLSDPSQKIQKNDPIYSHFPELRLLVRLVSMMTLPDMVAFLDTEPQVAVERIKGRGKEQQVHESPEKLQRLREGYRMVCGILEKQFKVPVHVFGGEVTIESTVRSLCQEAKELLQRGRVEGQSD